MKFKVCFQHHNGVRWPERGCPSRIVPRDRDGLKISSPPLHRQRCGQSSLAIVRTTRCGWDSRAPDARRLAHPDTAARTVHRSERRLAAGFERPFRQNGWKDATLCDGREL